MKQDIFGTLGYRKKKRKDDLGNIIQIKYFKEIGSGVIKIISFDLLDQVVDVYVDFCFEKPKYNFTLSCSLHKEEIKAISQKMKELNF